jgi:1-acyl-sn-glycerol-3-phosphate acyltransferase
MIVKPLVRVLFRCDFRGQDHIPRTGGCIIAPNHISYADPFVIALFVHDTGRRPRYLAKAGLWKLPFVKQVLTGARQIPVYRATADASSALRAAVDAVAKGECVVVYPEGTITGDPDLWPMVGKTGVARLALATGAPVIPVANWGSHDLLPYPSTRPRLLPRKRAAAVAGPPVDLSAWAGAEPTTESLRAVTAAVMADVAALLGTIRGEVAPEVLHDPGASRHDPRERRSA